MIPRLICRLWLPILIAGCTLQNGAPDTLSREDLMGELAALRAAQTDALAFWDRLIFGEEVSCQEYIYIPERLAGEPVMPAAEETLAYLDQARALLQAAADTWTAECMDGRAIVPLAVARQGRDSALAAGPLLDQAAARLAVWTNE